MSANSKTDVNNEGNTPQTQNQIFKGLTFCFSNISHEERTTLADVVRGLGAKVEGSLTNHVDILISPSVKSSKCDAARLLEIPIVRPSYVDDCHVSRQKLDISPYLLKLFEGLNICVSGIDIAEREQIALKCKDHGAIFSKPLEHNCTHLLIRECKGPKYNAAVEWKVCCVRPEWFYKSIEEGSYLDTTDFEIYEEGHPTVFQVNNESLQGEKPSSGQNSLRPRIPSTQIEENVQNSQKAHHSVDTNNQQLTGNNDTSHFMYISIRKSEGIDIDFNDEDDEESFFILAGTKIVLIGYNSSEFHELTCMIRHCGGMQVPDITHATHIVVNNPSEMELNHLQQKPIQGSVVTSRWLIDCLKSKLLLKPDAYVFNIPSSFFVRKEKDTFIPQYTSKRLKPKQSKKIESTIIEYPSQQVKYCVPNDRNTNHIDSEVVSATSDLEKNDINDVRQKPREQSKQEIKQEIKQEKMESSPSHLQNNGHIINYTSIDVPIIHRSQSRTQIQDSKKDITPQKQTFKSGIFLEPPMISFTGIHGNEKKELMQSIESLGGKIQLKLDKKVTLLIAGSVDSEKIHFAITNNIPIVKVSWVEECIRRNFFVPFENYIQQIPKPNAAVNLKVEDAIKCLDESMSFILPKNQQLDTSESEANLPSSGTLEQRNSSTTPAVRHISPVKESTLSHHQDQQQQDEKCPDVELLGSAVKQIIQTTSEIKMSAESEFSLTQQTSLASEKFANSSGERKFSRKILESGDPLCSQRTIQNALVGITDSSDLSDHMMQEARRLTGIADRQRENNLLALSRNLSVDQAESQYVTYDHGDLKQKLLVGSGVSSTSTSNINRSKVFLFSNIDPKDKGILESHVKQLDATVASTYSASVTHLIAGKPSKTEKFLCAVAAGIWILHPSFVTDSIKQKRWISEENYEWNSSLCEKVLEGQKYDPGLSRAVERCRKCGGKVFSDWIVVLRADQKHIHGFTNILQAGGAAVVNDGTQSRVTHYILHQQYPVSQVQQEVQELQKRGCICVYTEFIVESLSNPDPDVTSCKINIRRGRKRAAPSHQSYGSSSGSGQSKNYG